MIDKDQIIVDSFSEIFEKDLLEEIHKVGVIKKVKAGESIMQPGLKIKSIPLLINGAIKILREDEDGKELLLYFLEKGESCAMTMACCMGDARSEIQAIAESDATLLMIPNNYMEDWMAKYRSWRNYVIDSYHNRFSEMLETIDKIAFLRMDDRLIDYIQEKALLIKGQEIHVTHQEIADELNTSRVVVSRLLKQLENEGRIHLFRNRIKIISL